MEVKDSNLSRQLNCDDVVRIVNIDGTLSNQLYLVVSTVDGYEVMGSDTTKSYFTQDRSKLYYQELPPYIIIDENYNYDSIDLDIKVDNDVIIFPVLSIWFNSLFRLCCRKHKV